MSEQYHGAVTPYLRRFIEIVAAERTPGEPDLFDECVQEGMIAAWRAMERHPGHKDAYYRTAAKRGVLNVLRGRSPFGAESRRGSQDAHGFTRTIWQASGDGGEEFIVEPVVEGHSGALDVQADVRDALLDLPVEDRELAFDRYWRGRSFAEIGAERGVRGQRLAQHWAAKVRPVLRKALEERAA